MNENRQRLLELDYIRVIACFSVMLIHISAIGVTTYLPYSLHLKVTILINRSLSYAVPVFIFLSGFTSFYSYNKNFRYISFLKKKFQKILIPYFIWCLIYYFSYVAAGYNNFDIIYLIKRLITGNMCYHLYFIIILVQLYLLSPIFNYVFKKYNSQIILIVSAIITLICVIKLKIQFSDRIFLKYLIFFVLGIYANKEYDNFVNIVKKSRWYSGFLFFISSIIFSIAFYYKNYILMNYSRFAFSCISIFFIYNIGLHLSKNNNKVYNIIKTLSKSSYYIYLMHPLFLSISQYIVSKLGIQSITLILTFHVVFVMSVSTIISVLYMNLKDTIKSNKTFAS